ncbi:MAG: derlin [Lachnospiraceae bacterium]|nr:derlin [Lachnospiraceae bacterium]
MKSRGSFERRFGKYAIKNLSLVLIICYGFGYLFEMLYPEFLQYLYLNPYLIIFRGQVWRLVTWLIIPPSRFDFFTLLMLYFYYSIGTTLERTWGAYRYNVYIFSGMLFTILGAFLLFGYNLAFQGDILAAFGAGAQFSTYFVNMSIFLAFAATFPNMQVLLFFFIPIKIKVMGIIYGALLFYEFLAGSTASRFVIGASLMNFIVFFFTSRGMVHMTPRQAKRRTEFKREVRRSSKITRHKCAVCGRTEETNPELEFRFCSKCDGNYEYCEEHIFTHTHVKTK